MLKLLIASSLPATEETGTRDSWDRILPGYAVVVFKCKNYILFLYSWNHIKSWKRSLINA
jgi:hypothetical protein